ncbi:hypothetical protein K503DRAFT_51452 [Rhizopogon vinicolor AM-OR11-026]|uniref:Uncharacterized protein n=1 Tax=Rhizopogon vinicolor AM-OR11-026 TaxID=1314800 RepID=A0A1B7N4M8_9AGAM|nr:hypothetical protein K503DRAFT_51452 [Rhizopogon vinicolor AM-OR11-026]
MAFRKISHDVKRAAIHLYERELLNLQDILSCCGFSDSTWYRVLKLWRETGDVVSHPTGVRGRARHWTAKILNTSYNLSMITPTISSMSSPISPEPTTSFPFISLQSSMDFDRLA